ncbi:hypothetical protein M514_02602 [Trichuris suis]|uniref:Uncharacterized protein n=1 Tax=Trichuris suis TaxID=68888 RepID=A0A085MH02_9BILA|nr:hypothetical protein M513_02602 [Trichuris suis]KFD71027.1 hypothetical protein M514_02602 [Trichuris suis]
MEKLMKCPSQKFHYFPGRLTRRADEDVQQSHTMQLLDFFVQAAMHHPTAAFVLTLANSFVAEGRANRGCSWFE